VLLQREMKIALEENELRQKAAEEAEQQELIAQMRQEEREAYVTERQSFLEQFNIEHRPWLCKR